MTYLKLVHALSGVVRRCTGNGVVFVLVAVIIVVEVYEFKLHRLSFSGKPSGACTMNVYDLLFFFFFCSCCLLFIVLWVLLGTVFVILTVTVTLAVLAGNAGAVFI